MRPSLSLRASLQKGRTGTVLTAMPNPGVLIAQSLIGLRSALAHGSPTTNLHVCCVVVTTPQTIGDALELQNSLNIRTDKLRPTRKSPPANNIQNYPTLRQKTKETPSAGEFHPSPILVKTLDLEISPRGPFLNRPRDPTV
ncbi:hypothetical protein EVAR_4176_1 [Eumeta japonica]|uniref:Uncharacterized protein n=1 Tax=Eumeta variegata TaxID=151549 RepID=A0A4C1TJ40_EUMVA|nr:hypothetical protein EVAR_4176_1 [Eumeta japonica]